MEPDGTPVATTRQMVKGRVQQKGRQCVRVAEIEVGGDGLDAQERELITFQPPGSRSNHSRQVWWPSMEPPCPVSRWGRPWWPTVCTFVRTEYPVTLYSYKHTTLVRTG